MQTLPPVQLSKLQPDLIKLVKALQEDLRQRCDEVSEANAPLLAEYAQAQQAQRTQETFGAWRDNYLNQVAVAWVLACVFVRYLEDNGLVDECWLAGEGARKAEARERYSAFFRAHPEWSDREFFHDIFDQVSRLPGCHDLFGRDRNPLWKVGISGDGAKQLREFFADVDPSTGNLLRTFAGDTRFLGDLYQNLSEEAQKKYALLQTPDFVEEFILDRTLDPAIAEFGLDTVKIIDPTCGSGHFLLGSFARLLAAWQRKSPTENSRLLARRALEAVHGVDINPFAVAIARFRLVIAFVQACGFSQLSDMPDVKIHVATGDSLLHGSTLCSAEGWGVHKLFNWLPDAFASGDFEDASEILSKRYEAVVGNPPYITVRDKAQGNEVRSRYKTAYMKYSLAVPFKEKFWDLAVEAKGTQRAGFIGMITANSFMKREFGSRLIEEFFPRVDLTHVLDTSGAYIPGHGTPTVILLGRNRSPVLSGVRAVLGIRGEPSTPADPSQGQVWRSIVDLVDQPGEQNAFVSAADYDRETFGKHPWPTGGGGANELKEKIEGVAANSLGKLAESIGISSFTLEDDVFILPHAALKRQGIDRWLTRPMLVGDEIRDYTASPTQSALFLYDSEFAPIVGLPASEPALQHFWPFRTGLDQNLLFGSKTKKESGLLHYEFGRLTFSKFKTPLSIAFAEISTHNHFVLDRGGKVFKQTAPIIKLPEGASEDEHLALLGLLNSSTACFWFKQVCHNKGATSDSGVLQADPEKFRYCHDGSKVSKFPVPKLTTDLNEKLVALSRALDKGGVELAGLDWKEQITDASRVSSPELRIRLDRLKDSRETLRQKMVRWQEELDWLCYEAYGLSVPVGLRSLALSRHINELGLLPPDERPYRKVGDSGPHSRWQECDLARHAYLRQGITDLHLLERPEFKRRWFRSAGAYDANNLDDDTILGREVESWLADQIEDTLRGQEHVISCSQLADRLGARVDFLNVLRLYLGNDDFDLAKQVTALAQPQAVAFLAALRYSEAGLRVRADWEATWDLQRRQDAGEAVGDIAVPPKYGQKDFARAEYWSLRGKLDVPKERFISYPGAEREADGSPVLGWAGWNHLQRAQALASYVVERREEDGWGVDRVTPLLAGLAELLPWLKQWHNEVDGHTGERMGDYFEAFLGEQMRELELTPHVLAAWRPHGKPSSNSKPGRNRR